MLEIKITICLLIIYSFGIAHELKSCSDCMETRLCPDIRNYPKKLLKRKVLESLCGRKKTDDGKSSLMICCSDFAVDLFSRLDEKVETGTEIDISNHPNIGLLPDNCGKQFGDRIVGGTFANLYEFPWMALISLFEKKIDGKKVPKFMCGGTIISSRHILTAAHCVHEKSIAGIRVGEFDIHNKLDCRGEYPNYVCEDHLQDVRVKKAIIHEAYNTFPRVINDIAILRVNKEIDFSFKNVKPICLPVSKELRNLDLSGESATVAGWGITETGKQANILQKVTIPIVAKADCIKFLERHSPNRNQTFKNFCAGEVGKDSCKGDSGGPLMLFANYTTNNLRMIQYGIVSYGPVQCGSTTPGVYTDVSKYMKWILDNLD